MRYTVEITIRDNLLDDTVFIERKSDEPTWMWMANTMFDALRGASFTLPDNIDFPSISEMIEEYFDEEDPRSDGENFLHILSDEEWDTVYKECVNGYGGTD